MSSRVYLYDTTLRDGAQTQGVDFSAADKAAIATALDTLGIDYVEGGWPGANPTDDAFFAAPPPLTRSRLTAFGMTRRPGRSASNDPGLAALLAAPVGAITIVGKSWDFHVDVALGIPREENLALIEDSVAAIVARGREALFDAEHFFDGYARNPGYALDCLKAAHRGGAAWLVLCDTNGGMLPDQVEATVAAVHAALPDAKLGIHCHDDTGCAVANSLAAVRAGARMIQGTLNGLGERCGNADLVAILPSLMLKMGLETGVTAEALSHLTRTSRLLDERLNRAPRRNAAYVGESAFAHKGGLHVSAVEKDPASYEHVDPAKVGNQRLILVSDQSGRSNVVARLRDLGIDVAADDQRLGRLLEQVKQRQFEGYAYDGAEASFELLARRALGTVPDYFRLTAFRVLDEQRWRPDGAVETLSEATIKVEVGGETVMTVAEGNGPVNALDGALRKALASAYPVLGQVRLTDYKVRILTPQDGTGALTRVVIESSDGTERWSTVGISANVIDASYRALHDSLTWRLLRERVSS